MTAKEMAEKRWANARASKTPEQIAEAARNAANERWKDHKKKPRKPRRSEP
jgi:hypothetical protein